MNKTSRYRQFVLLAGSAKFFWTVVVLLVLQAAWIALSSKYPMAFDEDSHLGVIRLYADHLVPFWSGHPEGGDAFGAVARDPSYLYNYLLAFPYLLLRAVTDNEAVHVLALRAISIGLFVWGMVLYRRLLQETGAAKALVNLSLLILVLIPVTSLTAAQINYDNLIMPLTALALLLTLRVHRAFKKRSIDGATLLQLLLVCLAASLVKYAFLPILAAILLFLAVSASTMRPHRGSFVDVLPRGIGAVGLITALIIVSGLALERYGGNLVRYQTPVPDCGQVLSFSECKHYGPWIRDYQLEARKPADAPTSPLNFNGAWLEGMWARSFFAVAGPENRFQSRGPLTVPAMGTAVFAVLGGLALAVTARKLLRRYNSPALNLMTLSSVIYICILWVQQYGMFLQTGKPVAINGRYLLPVLPFLILFSALAVNQLLGRRQRLKGVVAATVIVCLLWGGGALTYILRSSDNWYWDNSLVRSVNHAVQDTLGPITPGYNRPTQYLP